MEDWNRAERTFLRHTLATIAYRGRKAVSDVPEGFSEFSVGPSSRTPGQILAHIGDLFVWALHLCKGESVWTDSEPRRWDEDTARFFRVLGDLDAYLASDTPLGCSPLKLFQGPIADALTHVGQIAMLRRMAGAAVKGENFFAAEITAGRVGAEQAPPKKEF